jgi:molecular chaperone GrpE
MNRIYYGEEKNMIDLSVVEDQPIPESERPLDSEETLETSLKREIDALKDRLDACEKKRLYALAEQENMLKRADRAKEELSKYAISAFAQDLLDSVDDLSRALELFSQDDTSAWVKGIRLTEHNFLSTLEKHGIKKIQALGSKVDFNLHEAVLEIESEHQEPGTIVQEFQAGFLLHGRLLRPARVSIVKQNFLKQEM